jgi:hypothetical protein
VLLVDARRVGVVVVVVVISKLTLLCERDREESVCVLQFFKIPPTTITQQVFTMQSDPNQIASALQPLRDRSSLDAARRFWFEMAQGENNAGMFSICNRFFFPSMLAHMPIINKSFFFFFFFFFLSTAVVAACMMLVAASHHSNESTV